MLSRVVADFCVAVETEGDAVLDAIIGRASDDDVVALHLPASEYVAQATATVTRRHSPIGDILRKRHDELFYSCFVDFDAQSHQVGACPGQSLDRVRFLLTSHYTCQQKQASEFAI